MSPDGDHRSLANPLVAALRRLGSWLTSTGINGQTEAQRSSERNRRAVASSIAGLALRGSSFLVVLVSVPLTLELLGPVRFGLWMTIASVVALLGATDLGIGNGLMNNIARAYGKGDKGAARRYLASGLVALTAIALTLGILFAALYPIVPWAAVYNVQTDPMAASEAGPGTAVFIATFLVGWPLGLVGQVRFAYQEGFVQSAFAGLGNVLTLGFLIVGVALRASLPMLVLALASGPLIAALLNLTVLVRVQRPWLAPRLRDVTTDAMRSVVQLGLAFMVLQVAYAVAFSTDRLVVAHIVGPSAVADYSVVARLFSIPAGLAAVALTPLWPAYREAISRNDIAWVRLTLKRSLAVTILSTVPLALVLAIVGPAIVGIWTSEDLSPTNGLFLALAALAIVLPIASSFGMLFNGAEAMRFQISTMTLMGIVNVLVSVYLASAIGVAGVAIGSVIAVVAVLIIPALVYAPRLLRRLERGGNSSVVMPTAEPMPPPTASKA